MASRSRPSQATTRARSQAASAADRKARYRDVLDALTELQDAAALVFRAWSRPLKFAPRDVEDPDEVNRMLDELERGPPAGLMCRELAERTYASLDGMEWGVTDLVPTGGAEVVWVRSPTGDDPRTWAQLIGHRPPEGWGWLEGRFPTCRGTAGRYVARPRPTEILEEIEAAGGVLRARPRSGSSSQ